MKMKKLNIVRFAPGKEIGFYDTVKAKAPPVQEYLPYSL
jgi:hypothetical protein